MARQSKHKWAGTTAAIVGSGALSLGVAQADVSTTKVDAAPAPTRSGVTGEATLELRKGRIFLIEAGQEAHELFLQVGGQADLLRRLVDDAGRSGPVRISPLVVADGAGGVQWVRPRQPAPDEGSGSAKKASASEQSDPKPKAQGDKNAH